MSPAPTLRLERRLLRSGASAVACIDEAGRGALCGPVSVGVVLITAETGPAPNGVRDSKQLSPGRRQALAGLIRSWAPHAVGMASSAEIDQYGIVTAMRLAGRRALKGLPVQPDLILLDGNHDYLHGEVPPGCADLAPPAAVQTRIRADQSCAGVAAASILAKVERDVVMEGLAQEHPGYHLEINRGYGSAAHLAAITHLGLSPQHRSSWRLAR